MPDGTINIEAIHEFQLETLPGAFVKLRQLPYHQMLVRRDKGTVVAMEQEVNQGRRGRKRGQAETAKMTLESLQTWEKFYMFSNCIVDHNITNKDNVKLDFTKEETLHFLRPEVGMEIERLIDDLNAEGDKFEEDFLSAHSKSSELMEIVPAPVES